MARYFIEVSYKGTRYSGFQIQQNANTIQSEIEKALQTILYGRSVSLTGSSRTDAGVHALQNYFHFDIEEFKEEWIYNLNAVLPPDIVVKKISKVTDEAHCRFDAINRSYEYRIYQFKNPFLRETAYYYPYPLDLQKLNEAAQVILLYNDFSSFSKKRTQVKTFFCTIMQSYWTAENGIYTYHISANRFLRGMVRALTATMLKVGRGMISIEHFKEIIESTDASLAFFNTPAHGLFLLEVRFAENTFI